MNERELKRHAYARYVNLFFVMFFLSDIPMPVNKQVLACISGAAFLGNLVLHLYAWMTRKHRQAAYLLLGLDLLTVGPAIYFTGLIVSPFLLVIPITLYTVYFIEYNSRNVVRFGLGYLAILLILSLIWWYQVPELPGWNPRDYPLYVIWLHVIQFSAIATTIYQSRQLPGPLVQELTQQEALLSKQAHRVELGTSLSVISHEIRTPLTTVSLNIGHAEEMIIQLTGSEKQTALKHLKISEQELHRINDLLESVLAYAKEKRGQYHYELCDIKAIADRAVEFTRLKYGRRNIEFQVECGHMDSRMLMCDRDAMHQVLVNLLDNAVQNRSVQRPLKIEINMGERNAQTVLSLRDNGSGIPADKLPQIFDKFMTSRAAGTGLGLSIVRQIVEDHGGTVNVHSTEGVGTTFDLLLSAVPSAPGDALTATRASGQAPGSEKD